MKTSWQKEWERSLKIENKYVGKCMKRKGVCGNRPFEKNIPEKLQSVLNASFIKAFEVIFEKGSFVIEKTYNKSSLENSYKINDYSAQLCQTRRSLRQFSKQAKRQQKGNIVVSAFEGIGLGLLGIGLPDIPVFTGLIIKSVYETALSFGYDYSAEEERYFILSVIETALLCGDDFKRKNDAINRYIETGTASLSFRQQIADTAKAVSDEILYMKFLQGIPIVGAVGGAGDILCLQKIQKYADIKYQRRFLFQKKI